MYANNEAKKSCAGCFGLFIFAFLADKSPTYERWVDSCQSLVWTIDNEDEPDI